jgi:hypothetical protein
LLVVEAEVALTLEEAVVQGGIKLILESQEGVLGSLLLLAFNYKPIT